MYNSFVLWDGFRWKRPRQACIRSGKTRDQVPGVLNGLGISAFGKFGTLSLDGHSKAPREIDCHVHRTPEIPSFFRTFQRRRTDMEYRPCSGSVDERAPVYISMPGIHYDHERRGIGRTEGQVGKRRDLVPRPGRGRHRRHWDMGSHFYSGCSGRASQGDCLHCEEEYDNNLITLA